MITHAGLVDGMKSALEKWLKLYPEDPEALDLKRMFEEAGGEKLEYIPALNDSDAHVALFRQLVVEALQ